MLKCCDDHIDKSRYSKLWQVPIKSDPCILERGLQSFNIFMGFNILTFLQHPAGPLLSFKLLNTGEDFLNVTNELSVTRIYSL